jgi:glycine cleavage system H lipoate-binding protein
MFAKISYMKKIKFNKINFFSREFSKLFTKQHEWIEVMENTNKAKVGISDYAQSELGTLVHVDLPEIDSNVSKGDSLVNYFLF